MSSAPLHTHLAALRLGLFAALALLVRRRVLVVRALGPSAARGIAQSTVGLNIRCSLVSRKGHEVVVKQ